ncbi:MAG: AzlD domain-containing protein [Lachnospiraceae bacterium]|jgi:branched-subunit amino acid transport protein AzlD|nr:AzlD domain-containing protein [Lachnospiraceae bacterium]
MMQSALIVAAASAVTVLLRFLPFMVFSGEREIPPLITLLTGLLPPAVMGMLVVYCLRGVSLFSGSRGLPELIASAAVVLSYVWKRSTLLSIVTGTALYMVLVQAVFTGA